LAIQQSIASQELIPLTHCGAALINGIAASVNPLATHVDLQRGRVDVVVIARGNDDHIVFVA